MTRRAAGDTQVVFPWLKLGGVTADKKT